MRKLILLMFLGIALQFQVINSQGFTVSQNRLLDANGSEFLMRGVNMPSIWIYNESYKAMEAAASLGVNTIRIVWMTKGSSQQLDSTIARCLSLKMIPMVELHDATGSPSADTLLKVISYYTRPEIVAVIHKYQKYILVNLANEWGNHEVTPEIWRDAYKRAIDTLRNAGITTTLVIDAPGWGQNFQPLLLYGWDLIDTDTQHNLLFSVHMYGSWNEDGSVEAGLGTAHNSKLPVIVGEFGYNFKNGDNNLGCKVNHKDILKYCTEFNIGFLAWSWTGNNEENAWLDLTEVSDWKTLSWWGKEIFEGENGIISTAKTASVFK